MQLTPNFTATTHLQKLVTTEDFSRRINGINSNYRKTAEQPVDAIDEVHTS